MHDIFAYFLFGFVIGVFLTIDTILFNYFFYL